MGSVPESGRSSVDNDNTPVFLPGKFHGHRSLAGCSLWGQSQTLPSNLSIPTVIAFSDSSRKVPSVNNQIITGTKNDA